MFDKVLNIPLDYLSYFAVVLRGIPNWLQYSLQTKNCPLFSSHTWKCFWIWCFCSFFHFLRSNVQCHKQKWRVLFFTRIKLVACVLACARAIARIKWRRMHQISKMELFAKIVNDQKPLTIFAGSSILDVYRGSEYITVISNTLNASVGRYKGTRTCSKGTRTISTDVNGRRSGVNTVDFEQVFSNWDWNIIIDSILIFCATEKKTFLKIPQNS